VSNTQLTATTVALLGSGSEAQLDGLTIARIRGVLEIQMGAADLTTSGFIGAVGIGIASQNAFGIGVTATMDPVADADWDGWMFHKFFSIHGQVVAAASEGDETSPNRHMIDLDTKAMRKITEGDTIYAAVEVTEVGTATLNVWLDSRVLLLLP